MPDYSFENLNDKEFEVLVNDLISVKETIEVDRYKSGKDGGVDGRFFTPNKGETIVQSKHWIKSGIAALIAKLEKEEVDKVRSLNPKRYILATSLPLSKVNKDKIKQIFDPYILSHNDIIGQENLNYLLGKFGEIERKHYKLWLSSSNVLSSMLNAALTGRSEAKRDDIINATKMYVVTSNHGNSLEKLENLHSVVITGEAGIGKTSLADQLAHHYIAEGYELCVIENDVSEAEDRFEKGKNQVFYFDDFLGRNYLMAIEGRKDSHVLNFLDRVSRDKTKRFILTSRSTVLSQGKQHSDLLYIKKIDKKEYEITIQSLSVMDRAKILYNHIWHSGLSEKHIMELYVDRRYLKIANHRNFNPRLISFITDPDRVSSVKPERYWDYITDRLDNPKDIWADVYDNQIDDLTRQAVCLLVFNGSSIAEEDLRAPLYKIAIPEGLISPSNASSRYTNMLKAAVGTVFQRNISSINGVASLDLFNPSVADFILGRYLDDALAMQLYFLSLNTLASLHNLKSLNQNDGLKNGIYLEVLKKLSREKITEEFYSENPEYALRLTQMITENPSASLKCDVLSAVELLCPLVEKYVPGGFVDEVSSILQLGLSMKLDRFQEVATKFISKTALDDPSLDELLRIEKLRKNIPNLDQDIDAGLLEAIQKEAVSYWKDEARQELLDNGVLEGFCFPEEEEDAYFVAADFIEEAMAVFGISSEIATEVAELVDVADILEENLQARSEEEYHYSQKDSGLGGAFGGNTEALVDDLFERD